MNTAVLDCVEENIREGISTAEIDRLVYEYTMDHQGIPATLGYHGFPNSCCISVNEVVCKGVKLSEQQKTDLAMSKTVAIENMISKAGNPFNAHI